MENGLDEKRIGEINKKISPSNSKKNDGKKFKSIQEQIKNLRKINEREERNRKTIYDQSREEKKFRERFDDLNVTIDFIPLEVYENYVFWGGTIDGIIQFAYKVTPDEDTSGVEFNYLEDFSVDNPENDEIVKRIEEYYDQFYQYWRDNIFQT